MEAITSIGIVASLISTVMAIGKGIRNIFKPKKKKPPQNVNSFNTTNSTKSTGQNNRNRYRAHSISITTNYSSADSEAGPYRPGMYGETCPAYRFDATREKVTPLCQDNESSKDDVVKHTGSTNVNKVYVGTD